VSLAQVGGSCVRPMLCDADRQGRRDSRERLERTERGRVDVDNVGPGVGSTMKFLVQPIADALGGGFGVGNDGGSGGGGLAADLILAFRAVIAAECGGESEGGKDWQKSHSL